MRARAVSAAALVVLVVAACGGSALGSRLDESAVPVALAWARADYVTFDCRRVVALETADYVEPRDCGDNRQEAWRDRVRVSIRDVSCGGTSNGQPVVTHDTTVVDVFLRPRGASWRVSAIGTYSADSALTTRRCPARLNP